MPSGAMTSISNLGGFVLFAIYSSCDFPCCLHSTRWQNAFQSSSFQHDGDEPLTLDRHRLRAFVSCISSGDLVSVHARKKRVISNVMCYPTCVMRVKKDLLIISSISSGVSITSREQPDPPLMRMYVYVGAIS
mgnify:FL=1